MRANLLANPEHYRTSSSTTIETKQDVIGLIKEFIRANVNGEDYYNDMFSDLEKDRNHVIKFDDSDDKYTRHGAEGNRVAYGAFRHSAFVHSVQTVWTYTFEIIDEGDAIYIGTDSWGWLHDADLSEKVGIMLE